MSIYAWAAGWRVGRKGEGDLRHSEVGEDIAFGSAWVGGLAWPIYNATEVRRKYPERRKQHAFVLARTSALPAGDTFRRLFLFVTQFIGVSEIDAVGKTVSTFLKYTLGMRVHNDY